MTDFSTTSSASPSMMHKVLKLPSVAYKVLHTTTPSYLAELINTYTQPLHSDHHIPFHQNSVHFKQQFSL